MEGGLSNELHLFTLDQFEILSVHTFTLSENGPSGLMLLKYIDR